jgi:hypothetical protein
MQWINGLLRCTVYGYHAITASSSRAFKYYSAHCCAWKHAALVNNVLGGEPIAVLFQEGSETASAVSRMINGQALSLEVRKNRLGKAEFYDRETGTRWTIEGRAVQGLLAGKSLVRIDSHLSQWYGWVSYFPDTSIFGRDREVSQPRVAAAAHAEAK